MVTATAVPTLMGPIHAFLTALGELKSHLAAAAVARSSSLLACYPIDTVKVRNCMAKFGKIEDASFGLAHS